MITTLVPDTLDYLVALFSNAATIGAADPPVTVFDGPVPTAGPVPLALWVGVDDVHTMAQRDPTLAADSEKRRNDASQGREETITVHCIAAAWTGNEELGYSPLRAAAKSIVTAVETITISDRANAPAFNQTPGVTAGEWWQQPLNGLLVYVPFQIIYTAL